MFIKEIAVTETMISQNPKFLTTSKTINQGELSDSQNWEKKKKSSLKIQIAKRGRIYRN